MQTTNVFSVPIFTQCALKAVIGYTCVCKTPLKLVMRDNKWKQYLNVSCQTPTCTCMHYHCIIMMGAFRFHFRAGSRVWGERHRFETKTVFRLIAFRHPLAEVTFHPKDRLRRSIKYRESWDEAGWGSVLIKKPPPHAHSFILCSCLKPLHSFVSGWVCVCVCVCLC